LIILRSEDAVDHIYQDVIFLIERLHRHFLEVVKTELDRLGTEDINNVQSLILFNIGEEELTVGELTNRGYYLGSNVSYNVKKMVENGYLVHERSTHDRRSIRVRLSDKGLELYGHMKQMFESHVQDLESGQNDMEELKQACVVLRHMEQFWTRLLALGLRAPMSSVTAA
jgi:DNA-binding MarR family transcriptional regulator